MKAGLKLGAGFPALAEERARCLVRRQVAAWLGRALLLVLCFGITGCGPDRRVASVCASLIEAFEPNPGAVVLTGEASADQDGGVTIRYRDAEGVDRWLWCRFAPPEAGMPLRLEAFATDRLGFLFGIRLDMLSIWFRLREQGLRDPKSIWTRNRLQVEGPLADRTIRAPLAHNALVFAQHLVNAMVVSCVYGWLAIAYTLVFGVAGRINLAFGEVHMVAAFVSVIGITLAATAGLGTIAGSLLAVFLFACVVAATVSFATDRWVFAPMRQTVGQAPLIAAVGLSIALQELVRLLQGAKDRWPPPLFRDGWQLIDIGSFSVHVLGLQIAIPLATLLLYALLLRGMRRSGYGRAYRACVDDAGAAALMGINVDRTVALTFLLAGAAAGTAGFFVALYYGGVNFFMGFLVGFKALTAAVVGGIGVVPGAMLGGLVVGVLETFWSAYFTIAYKEIAVFGLLALFLLFRPHGLLGEARGRGD